MGSSRPSLQVFIMYLVFIYLVYVSKRIYLFSILYILDLTSMYRNKVSTESTGLLSCLRLLCGWRMCFRTRPLNNDPYGFCLHAIARPKQSNLCWLSSSIAFHFNLVSKSFNLNIFTISILSGNCFKNLLQTFPVYCCTSEQRNLI